MSSGSTTAGPVCSEEARRATGEETGPAATGSASPGSVPEKARRMSRKRKAAAVMRVLRGESLEVVARETGTTAAALSDWRDAFLSAGEAALAARPRDDRDDQLDLLKTKLGEAALDRELLERKIDLLEGGRPLARRRSRR